MKRKEKAAAALFAVFPSVDSFDRFCADSENGSAADSFLAFALRHGLIYSYGREEFRAFLENGAEEGGEPPKHLSFEGLLDNKADLLKLNISLRSLTDRINALIGEQRIELPKVSNSMLTRLKKEPADTLYKQKVLRSLSFWLGHERGELGRTWNYETLFKLCREFKGESEHHKEGVRIGFSFSSRGDFIDHDVVAWLRKALKQHLEHKLDHAVYGRWGKVRSYDITTLYLDFPKESESDDPAAYRNCLKSAVFLAHQIAIKWALSDYCTKKRFLAVGIVAGEFATLDSYLLPILNAKLPQDPVLRVSDFVRQCLLINDIRVLLSPRPTEAVLFSGEVLSVWSVQAFWSFIYFDFVPELLQDAALNNELSSVEALSRLLWLPGEPPESEEPNAIRRFLKSPHNALLGVEIAKTLYFRRRFPEAIEVLRILISMDPLDLVARTLRMALLRDMALDSDSHTVSTNLFRMAHHEGSYIRENCHGLTEDFYCEFGIVHLAQGLSVLRHLRENSDSLSVRNRDKGREAVFASLERSEELFEKGMTVSSSGIRSAYLLGSVRVVKVLLEDDPEIFSTGRGIEGRLWRVKEQSANLLRQRGYPLSDPLSEPQYRLLERMLLQKVIFHNDSISLQAYRPTIHFTSAVVLWDYFPVRTVGVAKKSLLLLREAIETARSAAREEVAIYSFSRIYGQMIPAEEFVRHMERGCAMIEACAGDLAGRADDEALATSGAPSHLLLACNF